MKKIIILILVLLNFKFGITQTKYDSLTFLKFEKINSNIEHLLAKTDSLSFIYKQKTDSINDLKNKNKLKEKEVNLKDLEIISLGAKIREQNKQVDTINQYKIYLQSIISAIFNEPYNFNPKIINTVLDLKNKSYFTNSKYIDSLDKFYSICSGITEISKYFEEEAYNKDRVVKYKNILEAYQKDATKYKFNRLIEDIESSKSLLDQYCESTNKIVKEILATKNNIKARELILANKAEVYAVDYKYLLKVISDANKDPEYPKNKEVELFTCPVH